jgi:hypothetical protein
LRRCMGLMRALHRRMEGLQGLVGRMGWIGLDARRSMGAACMRYIISAVGDLHKQPIM